MMGGGTYVEGNRSSLRAVIDNFKIMGALFRKILGASRIIKPYLMMAKKIRRIFKYLI